MAQSLSGTEAWERLLAIRHARWEQVAGRFKAPAMTVVHRPKFSVSPDDRFFCIGSCFARNIEEHLIPNEIEVLSRKVVSPRSEWPGRPNGFLNKFTTHSMLNEIEWALEAAEPDEGWFEPSAGGFVDLQLSPGVKPVALQRAIARRRYLMREYFPRIRDANVVVLTLGLNEVWRDARTGRRLNAAPSLSSVKREPDRFSIEITDVAENGDALERIRAGVKALSPNAAIIVTVSPVPMRSTFSGKDVLLANAYSKSVLRCAAEEFAAAHDDVDYYPSFDIVSNSRRAETYAKDCLHVSDRAVGEVVRKFLAEYTGREPAALDFAEIAYLEANPDVHDAVRRGELASGFEHWQASGRAEGRPLKPDNATWMMSTVGAD